jgi:predicted nucleic acid-binding protein
MLRRVNPTTPRWQPIDAGEKAAIQLAVALHADLLSMDDRKGVSAAESAMNCPLCGPGAPEVPLCSIW